MSDSTGISIIHPNLYNGALERLGVEGLEVMDGDKGNLVLNFNHGDANMYAQQLAALALHANIFANMIVESNMNTVEEAAELIEQFLAPGSIDQGVDWRDEMAEMADRLKGVYNNIDNARKEMSIASHKKEDENASD